MSRRAGGSRLQVACLLAGLAGLSSPLHAAVSVTTGPTSIIDGEAQAPRDLTIANEHLAFALAVESAVPYGVPRGAIIDVAPVVNGKPGRDVVVFADFVPDNWSAWPNTYQKVAVLERGPARAVVRAVRDWGKVTVTTTYTLESDADHVVLQTTMTNGGDVPLSNLLSGHTLWPSAGFYFGVPGLGDMVEGKATAALADRAVAYDEDWAIALHAPYLDYVGSRSKDLFQQHSLAPGASRTFEAWLQVVPRGDLGPVLAEEIERKHAAAGTVSGVVTTRDGKPVAQPIVVIEKQGVPYGWSVGHDGRYEVRVPVGAYRLYATAKGYSQSAPLSLEVGAGNAAVADFKALDPPGRVSFSVKDARSARAEDARITISRGQRPLVEYLGRSTFFTELNRKGEFATALAPGRYTFAVAAGGGFVSAPTSVEATVRPGEATRLDVSIEQLFNPAATGWYAADLHHHADQAEGVTPPEYLARSQLAAGLDLLFVSDHDTTVNHAALQRIADARGVPFIASVELSPSWGHFNAWPLHPQGQKVAIDTSTATIDDVIAEARRQGALVVQSNHPFIPYGYLASLRAGVAPGGFNPSLDLLEINGDNPGDDDKVLGVLGALWTEGHRYYLSAGTDVHDVWNHESGRVRLFAHVPGKLTPDAFAQAVKDGHAYASYGPLIFPRVLFGSTLHVKPGAAFALAFDLKSVPGLKQATLVGGDGSSSPQSLNGAPREATVNFPLQAERSTWYAIRVEDAAGRRAYSDPIWIDVIDGMPPSSIH